MFSTWTNAKFKALYEAVQTALISGAANGRVIKWNAGDTGAENDQSFVLSRGNCAEVDAEFRQRWPDQGRTKYNRTIASFS